MGMRIKCDVDISKFVAMQKEIEDLDDVSVGWNNEKHYSGLNMATLAAIHSEGWHDLPRRSFMESAHVRIQAKMQYLNKMLMQYIYKGQTAKGLDFIGREYGKLLQDVLYAGDFSNNTVSKQWAGVKGFSDAMRHYGDLIDAVKYFIGNKQ